MGEMPFCAVGNEEIAAGEDIKLGDSVVCPQCGGTHPIQGGMENGVETDLFLFYKCGKDSYLAGMKGKLVPRFKLKKAAPCE